MLSTGQEIAGWLVGSVTAPVILVFGLEMGRGRSDGPVLLAVFLLVVALFWLRFTKHKISSPLWLKIVSLCSALILSLMWLGCFLQWGMR